MKLADLTQHDCEWLRGAGPMHDVVISTRVRLARNLAGMPFLSRCSAAQQAELETRLRKEILESNFTSQCLYVDVAAAGELDRQVLVERHLISRQHAAADHPRGVAISADETVAIMINEEDHLRMQVLRSGLQLKEAFDEICRIDDLLENRLDFAYHARFGYLTACPTNVGTGLRVSVMMHLPALKMTGEIEKVFRAARDMHLAVRGFYGEGTEAAGDFFQISNQTTLGVSEPQIVNDFLTEIIPHFIEYERQARNSLLKTQNLQMVDKIMRSMAMLQAARLISSGETMFLLSLVRLGVNSGIIDKPDVKAINDIFLMTQPAHLQRLNNCEMSPMQRAQARSELIRKRLGTFPN